MRKFAVLLAVFALFFAVGGCKNSANGCLEIEAPADVAARAFEFAKIYAESETEYLWGGQSPLRAIQIDCSGLVVMCYKYAVVDTKYSLLFNDASSSAIAEKYCVKTKNPRKGDLILMGGKESENITHIAIFEREENGEIYFVDSTDKPEEKINGVTIRHYPKDDARVKFFGRMKLYCKK